MRIQMLKAALATGAIAALGLGAAAANAATASASAQAKILKQITVNKLTDLQFGTIVTGAAASTVAIAPAGGLTCGAGLVCSGATSAASFSIGGTTGQVATISVPASVTLNDGAGNSMTASLAASAATTTLVAGAGSFSVGGTLSVGANQVDGDYAGTFNATVDYQ